MNVHLEEKEPLWNLEGFCQAHLPHHIWNHLWGPIIGSFYGLIFILFIQFLILITFFFKLNSS